MGSGEGRVLPSTLPHNREKGQFITHNRTFLRVKMDIIIRKTGVKRDFLGKQETSGANIIGYRLSCSFWL